MRFHKKLFQTDAESFSFLSWKHKKVLFPKKIFSKAIVSKYAKIQKMALAVLIFSEGFDSF